MTTMTKLTDTQRAERAISICLALDLGPALFGALESDLKMLRARDRALASQALVDAIAAEPDGDDWSCVPVSRRSRRRVAAKARR